MIRSNRSSFTNGSERHRDELHVSVEALSREGFHDLCGVRGEIDDAVLGAVGEVSGDLGRALSKRRIEACGGAPGQLRHVNPYVGSLRESLLFHGGLTHEAQFNIDLSFGDVRDDISFARTLSGLFSISSSSRWMTFIRARRSRLRPSPDKSLTRNTASHRRCRRTPGISRCYAPF